MADTQVAILGGGIAGCLTACLLADAGYGVTIVEARDDLMSGASLWNDGKIHLGYTFTGTPATATARLMQEGAAVLLPTLERVLGGPLPAQASADPAIYLVDRDSMVPAEILWERAIPEADRAPMIAGYAAWLLGLQGNWNVVADEPNSDALPYRAVREPIARFIARSHLSAAHAEEEPPSGR